ncbi:MAG TPA: GNAT family N-acetyltransferase [Urbifossiella sp.]|jgi:ribosomal protein S18 acetylase RimI-like enzyme|nr:GNAT family N-acetyltransferase [Urbifossiella sp.]
MLIHRAVEDDLADVRYVLGLAADNLHRRGIDQWPDGSPNFTPAALTVQIRRGEFWVVRDAALAPVAVIAISYQGDPDFWTREELRDHAVYLSKAAVVPSCQGAGLGAMLFRWAVDHAYLNGADWARLDAWSTNEDLHGYYRAQGWTFLRNDPPERRRSGALFQRPAAIDWDARAAFRWVTSPGSTAITG